MRDPRASKRHRIIVAEQAELLLHLPAGILAQIDRCAHGIDAQRIGGGALRAGQYPINLFAPSKFEERRGLPDPRGHDVIVERGDILASSLRCSFADVEIRLASIRQEITQGCFRCILGVALILTVRCDEEGYLNRKCDAEQHYGEQEDAQDEDRSALPAVLARGNGM